MSGISLLRNLLFASTAPLLLGACNEVELLTDDTSIPSSSLPSDDKQSSDDVPEYPEGVWVYEYRPAPGQFIGDATIGGMPVQPSTPGEACEWAMQRMEKGLFVSLGGFGGYIVMGVDDGIDNADGADFAVGGNAFLNSGQSSGGSNEPGIIYVMEDSNRNGIPDDTWYELRGSATLDSSTRRDYAVTYYRPRSEASDIEWSDNYGAHGTIDYLALLHRQPYYWPEWIAEDSYTLTGTCLSALTSLTDSGRWDNSPFPWGYADNIGSDLLSDLAGQWIGFDISNAIDAEGRSVILRHVNFIKVQTGVNAKAGPLGEVSTEVCGLRKL